MPIFDEFISGTGDAFLRLVAATLIGAAVGLNRELRGKPAGMRTHALVSLGAAIVMLSSVALATRDGRLDPNAVTRSVQGILAGIGFLGGGVILKTSDSRRGVRNLTTAASLWVVACIGVVCGAGQWPIAAAGLALTLLVLVIGGPVEDGLRRIGLRWVQQRDHKAGEPPRPHRRSTGEHRSIDFED